MTKTEEYSPTQILRGDKNERSTHGQESKTNIDNSQIINNYFNGLSEASTINKKSGDEIKEQKKENENTTLNEEIIQNIIKAKDTTEINKDDVFFDVEKKLNDIEFSNIDKQTKNFEM